MSPSGADWGQTLTALGEKIVRYGLVAILLWVGAFIGIIEIALGVLIATRPVAPKLSAIGSLAAIGMALITLTFVFTTPGVWQPGYGFPFPSPMPGQFLAKDILLLGAAVWTAGEALRAARTGSFLRGIDTSD